MIHASSVVVFTFAWLSILITLVSAAIPSGKKWVNFQGNFKDGCKFIVAGQSFDLCPLLKGNGDKGWRIAFENQTPPTVDETVYRFSLTGRLPMIRDVSKDEQCPDGSWACMIKYNRRPQHPDEPRRITQIIPVAGAIQVNETTTSRLGIFAHMSPGREDAKHDILHLRMSGGHYVSRRQSLDIMMYCDHQAEEPTLPTYFYNWNGTHSFRWKTRYACGQLVPSATVTATPPPSSSTDTPQEEEEDLPPNNEEEADDLLDPVTSKRSRTSLWVLFLSSSSVVMLLIYLIYWPPRILRQVLASFLKSHPSLLRFRVGESVLVRWAQEDMNLDDFEEDVMVNGEDDDVFFDDEEQIPLKPSPRKVRFASYGTAN
ncbi:autophagy-related protein 27-domain-containing protein [Abortiporus biennis]|nr:autophagy-related protein 27-domain-containing protein [Abortiporus biennis]